MVKVNTSTVSRRRHNLAGAGKEREQMTILIVDDDAVFRRALQRRLPGETRCAAGVLDALSVAASWQPSVVLLDVNLGGESSIDAIPRFATAAPRCELIMMTGYYDQADADRSIDLGALAYVEKWNVRELCELVQDARVLVRSSFVSSSRRALH